jgi:hypothetical protein
MMTRFGILFPELARKETRTAMVLDPVEGHLPVDEYGFDEWYCDERGCDCRRVMINVLARGTQRHLATINHAFDLPRTGALVSEQTFLDPLNTQAEWSDELLDLFINIVLHDEAYRQRLMRHYQMFKRVVNDPCHPHHYLLRPRGAHAPPPVKDPRAIVPPPPRRGRRRKGWG